MLKKPISKASLILGVFLILAAITVSFLVSKDPTEPGLTRLPPLIERTPFLGKSDDRSPANAKNKHPRRTLTVLIKPKANATSEQKDALKQVFEDLGLRKEKEFLNGRAFRLRISRQEFAGREEEVAAQIERTGAVDFAEPDFSVVPSLIPNDYYFSSQWHHSKIQSPQAWNYTRGNSQLLIGICDAGFDVTHPDLAAHFVLPGYNTVRNNGDINNVNDHGTMSAGVLAGIGNNSRGVAGMAWNVRMLPIQISDQPNGVSSYSDVTECIEYSMNRGAKVVNISYDYNYTSSLINQAALVMRNSGGLVVTAAGNSTVDISNWGQSPMVIVGATDQNDNLTWFSNFGSNVDLYAPGLDLYSTTSNDTYSVISGTSFSTPVVSGAIALLYSLNLPLTPDKIENYILATASTAGNLKILNIGAAIQRAVQAEDTVAPQVTITSPVNGASVTGTINVTATATDNVRVGSVEFRVDGITKATDNTVPYSFSLDTGTLSGGTHAILAIAKDSAGKTSSTQININVSNGTIAEPILLDNLTANVSDNTRISTGTWCKTNQYGSYGTPALNNCGSGVDKYRFVPVIPAKKSYAVSIRFLQKFSQTDRAPVVIKSAFGQSMKTVNMRKDGGTWVPLGVYTFEAGTSNYVELSDSAGNVSIDGLKFDPINQ